MATQDSLIIAYNLCTTVYKSTKLYRVQTLFWEAKV